MDRKKCIKCNIKKYTCDFHKDKSKADGLRPRCKQCRKKVSKVYYEENKEQIIDKVTDWRNKNRPRFKKYNSERKKKKRREDPVFVLKERISNSIRKSFRDNSVTKKESSFKMLGYTPRDLFSHLNKFINYPCQVCESIEINIHNSHIDHILPISLGKNKAEIIELNQIKNLRLICVECNLKKSNKLENL